MERLKKPVSRSFDSVPIHRKLFSMRRILRTPRDILDLVQKFEDLKVDETVLLALTLEDVTEVLLELSGPD